MDEISPIAVLIIGGILIRFSLIYAGQNWARNYAQTISFLILPIITYVITKTISGNIALSLGMIGALSIVRFRHPVKSALELVIYFDLITIGIATSVRTKWSIQLILCTVVVILIIKFINEILKKSGKSFYSVSFNEGISLNSIEIVSTKKIDLIEESEFLTNCFANLDEKEFIYRLSFADKKQLSEFKTKIENLSEIKKINVDLL